MLNDVQLAGCEKIASYLYIIASVLIIKVSNLTQEQAADNNTKSNCNSNKSTNIVPAEIIYIVGILYLIGNLIFLSTSSIRLSQSKAAIESENEDTSTNPNSLIVLGWVFSVLGSIIRLKGNKLKLNQTIDSKA